MNEFICGFEVPEMFQCLGGETREEPYRTEEDFKECSPIAFRCKGSRITLGLDSPFKGFYPEMECDA